MYSHFESHLGFGLTQVDDINSGTTIHVVSLTQLVTCLLMQWQLWEPMHQQAWYWPPKPEYSVSSIEKVNYEYICAAHIANSPKQSCSVSVYVTITLSQNSQNIIMPFSWLDRHRMEILFNGYPIKWSHVALKYNWVETRQIRTPVLRIPPAVTSQAKMKNWLHECQKWVSYMIGQYAHI